MGAHHSRPPCPCIPLPAHFSGVLFPHRQLRGKQRERVRECAWRVCKECALEDVKKKLRGNERARESERDREVRERRKAAVAGIVYVFITHGVCILYFTCQRICSSNISSRITLSLLLSLHPVTTGCGIIVAIKSS